MMILKSKGLTKSQQCQQLSGGTKFNSLLQENYQDTQKKAMGDTGKQEELLKKFKDPENFFDFGQNRWQCILKFRFIRFWRNTLCLRHTSYNQVILKIIPRQSRLFAKKTQLYL